LQRPRRASTTFFDNTGTAKTASTFNLNLEAISKHVANHLMFHGPLAALAILQAQGANHHFLNDPENSSNLVETTKRQRKYIHAHNQQKSTTL
jgi:hypothetical protein